MHKPIQQQKQQGKNNQPECGHEIYTTSVTQSSNVLAFLCPDCHTAAGFVLVRGLAAIGVGTHSELRCRIMVRKDGVSAVVEPAWA